MSYASKADLIDRYGQRELVQTTDKAAPPTGTINDTTVSRALSAADAEIDSRLGLLYAVPITGTVPQRVIDCACKIARFYLHEDRVSDQIRDAYKDELKWLDDVARGRATIPGLSVDTGSVDAAEGDAEGGFAVRAPAEVFTGSLLELMP